MSAKRLTPPCVLRGAEAEKDTPRRSGARGNGERQADLRVPWGPLMACLPAVSGPERPSRGLRVLWPRRAPQGRVAAPGTRGPPGFRGAEARRSFPTHGRPMGLRPRPLVPSESVAQARPSNGTGHGRRRAPFRPTGGPWAAGPARPAAPAAPRGGAEGPRTRLCRGLRPRPPARDGAWAGHQPWVGVRGGRATARRARRPRSVAEAAPCGSPTTPRPRPRGAGRRPRTESGAASAATRGRSHRPRQRTSPTLRRPSRRPGRRTAAGRRGWPRAWRPPPWRCGRAWRRRRRRGDGPARAGPAAAARPGAPGRGWRPATATAMRGRGGRAGGPAGQSRPGPCTAPPPQRRGICGRSPPAGGAAARFQTLAEEGGRRPRDPTSQERA